ncbi:MAG: hypothetical protein ABIG30_01585 [Candidatus Aenigmatarchaeota archaeon]
MNMTISKFGEIVAARGSMVTLSLGHALCSGSGAYKGFCEANRMEANVPFQYFWLSNAAGTASLGAVDDLLYHNGKPYKNAAVFGALGIALAPAEFAVGYCIGYTAGLFMDKVIY